MLWGPTSPADGFAIAMLGMILLALGIIGLLIICMRRNSAKRDPQVDALLDELAEEERAAESTPWPAPKDPQQSGSPQWEREADWWKQTS